MATRNRGLSVFPAAVASSVVATSRFVEIDVVEMSVPPGRLTPLGVGDRALRNHKTRVGTACGRYSLRNAVGLVGGPTLTVGYTRLTIFQTTRRVAPVDPERQN